MSWRTGCEPRGEPVMRCSDGGSEIHHRRIDDGGRQHDVNELEQSDEAIALVVTRVGDRQHRRAGACVLMTGMMFSLCHVVVRCARDAAHPRHQQTAKHRQRDQESDEPLHHPIPV